MGFADSAYLTAKFYLGSPVTCRLLEGCETVTSSRYAVIGGVPIALAGAAYYLFFFLAAVWYADTKSSLFFPAVRFTVIGFIVSLILIGIQVFILKAICEYCIFSAVMSTILFISAVVIRKGRSAVDFPPISP